jgi:hypothetical protein
MIGTARTSTTNTSRTRSITSVIGAGDSFVRDSLSPFPTFTTNATRGNTDNGLK